MPFTFYFFGKEIRAKPKFAPAQDLEQESRRRDQEARGAAEQPGKEGADAPKLGVGLSNEGTGGKRNSWYVR